MLKPTLFWRSLGDSESTSACLSDVRSEQRHLVKNDPMVLNNSDIDSGKLVNLLNTERRELSWLFLKKVRNK